MRDVLSLCYEKMEVAMNWRRWSVIGMIVAIGLGIAVPIASIRRHEKMGPLQEADTLIVLGCHLWGDGPSLFLRMRLDAALEVYEQGLAQNIIVSGGQGPDEVMPEAKAMMIYLVNRGVPEHRIFMEDLSTSTYENVKFSKEVMDREGFKSAIIVTSDFHIFRSVMIARKLGIEASGAPAAIPEILGVRTRYVLREIPAIYRDIILR